ncbi:MAG TPA: adenylate/guanylate cyclase domain-containing protein, partial [Geminicoccaceae bacterium]
FRLKGLVLLKLVLGVTATVWLIALTPLLRQVEAWTIDMRLVLLSPTSPARDQIVVVAIDEAALADLPYRAPIDRGFLADVAEAVVAAGPRAIGIDVLFDRPSEADKDSRLEDVLSSAEVPVVVAYGGREDGLTAAQAAYLDRFSTPLVRGRAIFQPDPLDARLRTVEAASDGQVGFAGALYQQATGASPPDEPFFLAPALVAAEGTPFRVVPARVLAERGSGFETWLRDRIVLIGAVLPGDDRHDLARGTTMADVAGVEVHGHILARLLDGFRPEPAPAWASPLLLLVSAAIGVLLVAWRAPTWQRLAIGSAFVLVALGATLAIAAGEVMLPVAGPAEAALVAVASTRLRIAAADRAQRRFLHRAFGKYISPALVQRLLDRPDELRVGGERREVTALYTDLEGFTALTEALPPDTLIGLLNPYLDGICRIVVEHGGIVDKLVGDAVVALFNAPLDLPRHPARAVAAALEIDAFSKRFIEEQTARLGRPFGRTRIGVATGVVTVGNFGGEVLFDYTAQGPAMNLGARLEAANRELGTTICVAASTAAACPEYVFRALGTVRAKGFSEPVEVCTPVLAEEEEDAREQKGAA